MQVCTLSICLVVAGLSVATGGVSPARFQLRLRGGADGSNKLHADGESFQLQGRIKEQGDKVRNMKAELQSGVGTYNKDDIDREVQVLKDLKKQLPAEVEKRSRTKPESTTSDKPNKPTKSSEGITASKSSSFASWYPEVLLKAEMIDYYDVSGCYILRPWAYSIWERIQATLDERIKALGADNCYFPMFVSQSALQSEQEHVEGFTPEVAWVTKAGSSDLAQPVAIRPTSETVMYPAFRKWIRSHRDLPLKLNQWCNVVRWEFKNPTPFLRTREFLWQEGHTAHATKAAASEEVLAALGMYEDVYSELLAVPVIKGRKTEREKFAGALFTTTVEAFIPAAGRGIQGATSHCLGQGFGAMFDISFEDEERRRQTVWQNSWGMTTRTIGVMVMVHADDRGLVLPPRVSPVQLIVVPVISKRLGIDALRPELTEIEGSLTRAGVRTKVDADAHRTPGWKYNHWEMKGVPLRLEIGPRDLEKRQVRLVRRDTSDKEDVPRDQVVRRVLEVLDVMQTEMLQRATAQRDAALKQVGTWDALCGVMRAGGLALAASCGESECEEGVCQRSKADANSQQQHHHQPQEKPAGEQGGEGEGGGAGEAEGQERGGLQALCVPFEQPPLDDGAVCVGCPRPAVCHVLYGRSY